MVKTSPSIMVDYRPFFSKRKLWLVLVSFCIFYLYKLCLILYPTTASRREMIVAYKAAIATDDERCSEIGLNVLLGTKYNFSHPGNAVDAAVAATFCLGVVSPASSGIGGGASMLLRMSNGFTEAFDMREVAPMNAREDIFKGNATMKAKRLFSIGVPGELKGLYKVWKENGTLPWEKLVEPAIDLAKGFEISPNLYSEMVFVKADIFENKGLRDIFTLNGRLLQSGDICKNEKLAETLKTISKDGANALYNGPIGENLIRDIENLGGIMNISDLQSYEVEKRDPISAYVLGMTILGLPPPSVGGAGIVLVLNILAQYLRDEDITSPIWVHREIEALKHVFAIRMNLGDPVFNNSTNVVSDMLSSKFAKELKETINDYKTFGPNHYGGESWRERNDYLDHEFGTSHLSVIDAEGNAVALTASLNYHFGSKILSPSTGILLNNQMADFSFHIYKNGTLRANNNYVVGGKRPQTSMSPTIILKDNKLRAVIGASGGTKIIPGVLQVLLNHFIKGKDQLSSVMAPRFYHQWIPNELHYEDFTTVSGDHFEFPTNTRIALGKKGHVLQGQDTRAVCQFITLEKTFWGFGPDKIVAVSDVRKGGVPAGY